VVTDYDRLFNRPELALALKSGDRNALDLALGGLSDHGTVVRTLRQVLLMPNNERQAVAEFGAASADQFDYEPRRRVFLPRPTKNR
jgi:hypothetical protein